VVDGVLGSVSIFSIDQFRVHNWKRARASFEIKMRKDQEEPCSFDHASDGDFTRLIQNKFDLLLVHNLRKIETKRVIQ